MAAAIGMLCSTASAVDFVVGEVEARLDTRLSYGVQWRTKGRNKDLIPPSNGGRKLDPNGDDGNMNYDNGDVIANAFQATSELTLKWENFGAFARATGFYDFENHDGDMKRTDLRGNGKDHIGRDLRLLDAYVSYRFLIGDKPTQIRIGDQVINWGESVFFGSTGIDIVNPLDIPAFQLPTSTPRDLYRPVGMFWASSVLTDHFSVEFFYEYEWEPTRLPPVGSYFSTSDVVGAGAEFALLGDGLYSDLGTDLDERFGFAPGTFGFDENFFRLPRIDDNRPKNDGQFGITLQAIFPELNDSKLALHFINYHSRFPLIMGRTANQQAVDAATDANWANRIAAYSALPGGPNKDPVTLSLVQMLSEYANQAGYFLEYPEDIKMIGLSFNTTTLRTGTALSWEISHHIDVPMAYDDAQILRAVLSPFKVGPLDYTGYQLGAYGADEIVKGYIERDKTQVVLGATQFFGPQLGAAQTIFGMEIGWLHISDMPDKREIHLEAGVPEEFGDANSWGYRALWKLDYTSVFGGVNVSPLLIWSHDVNGNSPWTAGTFREGQKSVSFVLSMEYLSALQIDFTYVDFLGDDSNYQLNDRDFFGLKVSYSF